MSGVLNEILARLFMVFGPDDIAQGVEVLSQGIRDTVLTSPIGQVGPVVHDFLDEVRQAIEDVPTEQIQTTVEDMLGRVKEELDSLGIEHIGQTIEDAFNEVEAFITDRINDALTSDVRVAMQGLLRDVQTLPVADLITELGTLVNELAGLIQEIGAALDARMDDLRAFLSQAEQLSFKPISDEVIEEIDSVKARLQSINPDALSETEKLALRAALAVLESLELETKVVKELKKDFRLAENEVKSLLSDLTSILERLRDRLGQYRPDSVLGPVNAALQQLTALVDRLNAGILLNPLYGQVDKLVHRAETLSPGQLLDKLQGPYAEMVGVVERLDPAKWTAPLKTLYQQIDAAIALVDVTPVLDELDRQQRALFARIQKAITDALTHLNLPEPLNSFFAGLQPIVTALTDAIFDAPDTEVQAISLELSSQFNVGSIFAPLDAAFDQLVAMLAGVPQAAVVDTLNALRQGLGVALDRPGSCRDRGCTSHRRSTARRLGAPDGARHAPGAAQPQARLRGQGCRRAALAAGCGRGRLGSLRRHLRPVRSGRGRQPDASARGGLRGGVRSTGQAAVTAGHVGRCRLIRPRATTVLPASCPISCASPSH